MKNPETKRWPPAHTRKQAASSRAIHTSILLTDLPCSNKNTSTSQPNHRSSSANPQPNSPHPSQVVPCHPEASVGPPRSSARCWRTRDSRNPRPCPPWRRPTCSLATRRHHTGPTPHGRLSNKGAEAERRRHVLEDGLKKTNQGLNQVRCFLNTPNHHFTRLLIDTSRKMARPVGCWTRPMPGSDFDRKMCGATEREHRNIWFRPVDERRRMV